jgi:hypothetical protein
MKAIKAKTCKKRWFSSRCRLHDTKWCKEHDMCPVKCYYKYSHESLRLHELRLRRFMYGAEEL